MSEADLVGLDYMLSSLLEQMKLVCRIFLEICFINFEMMVFSYSGDKCTTKRSQIRFLYMSYPMMVTSFKNLSKYSSIT